MGGGRDSIPARIVRSRRTPEPPLSSLDHLQILAAVEEYLQGIPRLVAQARAGGPKAIRELERRFNVRIVPLDPRDGLVIRTHPKNGRNGGTP